MRYLFFIGLIIGAQVFAKLTPIEKIYEKGVTNFTDHLIHFEKLFQRYEVNNFLEFGLGDGTKYFLENCKSVHSVELITQRNQMAGQDWLNDCIAKYKNYTNWEPKMIFCGHYFNRAENISETRKDPYIFFEKYTKEIEEMVSKLFEKKQYDVVFVDPGVHLRGEIVRSLFQKCPVIVAHDTNATLEVQKVYYGWDKVRCPSNYVEIKLEQGSGTTFWIRNDRKTLIDWMQSSN